MDHFKAVNDEFGHDAGEPCTQSNLLKFSQANTRETDLLIRYGSEEFLVILMDCTCDEACTTGRRLRDLWLSTFFEIDGRIVTGL